MVTFLYISEVLLTFCCHKTSIDGVWPLCHGVHKKMSLYQVIKAYQIQRPRMGGWSKTMLKSNYLDKVRCG